MELPNSEGRINTPAVAEGNWTFRVKPTYATKKLKAKVLDMAQRTNRANNQ